MEISVTLKPLPMDDIRKLMARLKVVVADEFYEALEGSARAQAFTISGLVAADQLQAVLDTLSAHLRTGGTFRDWQETVRDTEFGAFPAWRRELVYRNNLNVQYAAGRGQHILAHRDARPYLVYSAVGDSRTRPEHLDLDGFVASVESPAWQRIYPPNGHGCRCDAIPLTREQAEAEGIALTVPDMDIPDDWAYSVLGDPDAGIARTVTRKLAHFASAIADKLRELLRI